MAKKIQAWVEFGPRIALGDPMTKQELIENVVAGTSQTKGSVLSSLAEMDVQLEAGLKAGRIVQLPNGTHFEPVGKKDGSVEIVVRVSPELVRKVNNEFRGKWINAGNKGKSQEEIIAFWNAAHPDDLVEV